MTKRGENIYYRKDGRWEGRYICGRTSDGRAKFVSIYGKRYSDVKRQLVMIKSELYRTQLKTEPYSQERFCAWTEQWLEEEVRPGGRPGTFAGYRRNLDKHIYPEIGDIPLRDIRSFDIQNSVNVWAGILAPGTVRGIFRLLKSILSAAYERGLIHENPCRNIRIPKLKARMPRVLTRGEQEILEKRLGETGETEYLLCLYTGIRVGELCALQWKDIDLQEQMLHIRHSIQRIPSQNGERKTCLVCSMPKTDTSRREIPLPDFLVHVLRKKNREAEAKPNDFVFPGTRNRYKDPRALQRRIHSLCDELGIREVHMHTLRHTFATRCLEQNIGYEVLSEFLGHSSPRITLSCYAHCTLEEKRKSIERLTPECYEQL